MEEENYHSGDPSYVSNPGLSSYPHFVLSVSFLRSAFNQHASEYEHFSKLPCFKDLFNEAEKLPLLNNPLQNYIFSVKCKHFSLKCYVHIYT